MLISNLPSLELLLSLSGKYHLSRNMQIGTNLSIKLSITMYNALIKKNKVYMQVMHKTRK
jgi:hypothetical protein